MIHFRYRAGSRSPHLLTEPSFSIVQKLGLTRFILINTTKTTLGPSTLISYLHSKGIPASLLYAPKNDDNLYSDKDLESILEEIKSFSIIGFSFFSIGEARTFKLIKFIKEKFPKKLLIVGGPSVIMNPERMIKRKYIDAVCVHEGEIPLGKLITEYPSDSIYAINGIWIKSKRGRIFKNPFQYPMQDIDEIPFTNFKKSPLGYYKRLNDGIFEIEVHMTERIEYPCARGGLFHVMASRGCPYSCSYCVNGKLNSINKRINSRVIRKRSVGRLIDDIRKVLSKETAVEGVFFFDNDFLFRSELEL